MVSRMPPVPCGIAEYTSMLVEEMVKSPGISVTAIGGDLEDLPQGSWYREPYSGINVINCFAKGDIYYLLKCISEVRQTDLIHLQHEYGIFTDTISLSRSLKAIKLQGTPIISTLHTVIHALGDEELLSAQRYIIEASDVVIVHSILQESELIRQGFPVEKVYRIPHGTLINPYLSTTKSNLIKYLPLEVREDDILVSVPGFLRSRDKDYFTLVKAFDLLAKKYDIKLIIAGSPRRKTPEDIALEEFIKETTIDRDYITFFQGFLERSVLLRLLAISDIIVVPIVDQRKHPISVSGVFHLAIGSKKPVVCTRSHKLIECNYLTPELTLHNYTVEHIATKIIEVIENPGMVKNAVDKLWNYALETRWEIVTGKHLEIYEAVV